jgi:Fe2+ transport system protein FeoA
MKLESIFNIELSRMPEGVPGRIGSLEAASTDRDRLEAMGLCVGRTVEVVRAGDPMIVRVLGTRIGLAAVLARTVRVEADRGGW